MGVMKTFNKSNASLFMVEENFTILIKIGDKCGVGTKLVRLKEEDSFGELEECQNLVKPIRHFSE